MSEIYQTGRLTMLPACRLSTIYLFSKLHYATHDSKFFNPLLQVPKNFKIYLIIIRNSQTSSNLLILLRPCPNIQRNRVCVCCALFHGLFDNSKFEICQNDHPQDQPVLMSTAFVMGSSPGELSEELVTQEKRKKGWRMNCDVGKATEELENEL